MNIDKITKELFEKAISEKGSIYLNELIKAVEEQGFTAEEARAAVMRFYKEKTKFTGTYE